MENRLKYPIGCKISWCGEEYIVVENYNDRSGKVRYENDDQILLFYFNYAGEEAVVINQ